MDVQNTEGIAFFNAIVGDLLIVPVDVESPAGWHVCDGTQLISHEWPEFVTALGISGPTFELPNQAVPEGSKALIKLGARLEVPKADPIPVADLPEGPLKSLLTDLMTPPRPEQLEQRSALPDNRERAGMGAEIIVSTDG